MNAREEIIISIIYFLEELRQSLCITLLFPLIIINVVFVDVDVIFIMI